MTITIISDHDFLQEALQQIMQNEEIHTYKLPPSLDLTKNNLIIIDSKQDNLKTSMRFVKNYCGLVTIIYLGDLAKKSDRVISIARPVNIALLARHLAKIDQSPVIAIYKDTYFNPKLRLVVKLSRASSVENILTEKESELLQYLISHRGEIIHKDKLLLDIFSYSDGTSTHTLETHMYRLRSKIPADIITARDGGYGVA